MAARCPVVMTDVGCAGELLKNGENGLVVPMGERQKLVGAIIKIRTDGQLAARLGEAAGQAVSGLPSEEEYLARYKKSWWQTIDD